MEKLSPKFEIAILKIAALFDLKVHPLIELAYMATSGGRFSRPSGMGSFWS